MTSRERTQQVSAIIAQLRPVRTLEETAQLLDMRYQSVQHIERLAIWKISQRLRELMRGPSEHGA
jgi:hypothetical protein